MDKELDKSKHRKKIFKVTTQRTDRKKVNNRDRKMHKSEDRNKNSQMKTLRGKN